MAGKKRSIPLSALMEFDSLEESSEDSDFRIEDHSDESNEENTSDSEELEVKSDSDCTKLNQNTANNETQHDISTHIKQQECKKIEFSKILICGVCLGDKSEDDNEIVECDNCGVTVHEYCYGISDSESISSSDSVSSKMPWFCEACLAGKETPVCELCPNAGGIFKETDTGRWVHLVCALYIPGVAFRDVDELSNVTLFEMSYSKWGERVCSLCPDQKFAQTGVCISCDAGLCRAYFHVTCAQKEGLLSEAQWEEMNHADPFYAHCKLHSDKEVSKVLKRNWLAFKLQMAGHIKEDNVEGCNDMSKNLSLKENLKKLQQKYAESKISRGKPWIPTQKMPRPLTSCASTLRSLSQKAILSGINTQAMAMNEAHTNALADVHRKWHISPAFNVEYMGYYLDRNSRIDSLKQKLNLQIEDNSNLIKEQSELQILYDRAVKEHRTEVALGNKLRTMINNNLEFLTRMNLTEKFPKLCETLSDTSKTSLSESCPNIHKPRALGKEEHTIIKTNDFVDIPESLCLKCVTCKKTGDQHLLVQCDTCLLYYHLSCLDPPLTRMPKKTKVMGWQCTECDKTSSDSDVEAVGTETPRQLRQFKGNWRNFPFSMVGSVSKKKKVTDSHAVNNNTVQSCTNSPVLNRKSSVKSNKKKEIKKHQKDFIGSENTNPLKFTQPLKELSPIINKNVCLNIEQCATREKVGHPSIVKETECRPGSVGNLKSPKPTSSKCDVTESETVCDTCQLTGTRANIVTCDECLKGFHFHCLNPPVKKSPKCRGYSWHCSDCDASESDSD